MENTTQNLNTVVVSLSEITGYKDQINTLQKAVQQGEVVIATKDQTIKNLKDEKTNDQLVIIKTNRGWGSEIVETRNLESVKEDIRKEEESKLGNELIKLRVADKLRKQEIDELKLLHSKELSRKDSNYEEIIDDSNKDHNKVVNELEEKLTTFYKESKTKVDDLKKSFDKKESTLLDQIKELQLQLEDKSEQQKLEKEISNYKSTIKDLTKKFEELTSGSKIAQFLRKISFSSVKKEWVDSITDRLDSLRNTTNSAYVRTEIPKNFNKYATKTIYKEGKIEEVNTGEQESYFNQYYGWNTRNITKKIATVQFEV